MENYYRLLKLPHDADPARISQAMRQAAERQTLPLETLQAMHKVLFDPEKRSRYNTLLHQADPEFFQVQQLVIDEELPPTPRRRQQAAVTLSDRQWLLLLVLGLVGMVSWLLPWTHQSWPNSGTFSGMRYPLSWVTVILFASYPLFFYPRSRHTGFTRLHALIPAFLILLAMLYRYWDIKNGRTYLSDIAGFAFGFQLHIIAAVLIIAVVLGIGSNVTGSARLYWDSKTRTAVLALAALGIIAWFLPWFSIETGTRMGTQSLSGMRVPLGWISTAALAVLGFKLLLPDWQQWQAPKTLLWAGTFALAAIPAFQVLSNKMLKLPPVSPGWGFYLHMAALIGIGLLIFLSPTQKKTGQAA